MANTFQIKRSAVAGKVPLVTDLTLGEFAINTTDGKVFIKKNVSGVESIVDVTAGGLTATDILNYLKTVDGAGSGLDADLLDGLSSGSFFRSDASNAVDARLASGDGRGLRFWDSDSYKVYMSTSANATFGGRLDTTSDYNMYFRMTGGTNRGFVFLNNTTPVLQIESTGQVRAAGAIIATGFTGPLTGNASTATALQTTRTIALSGDVTGSASFDGSANVTITATVADDSHTHDTQYLRKDTASDLSGTIKVLPAGNIVYSETGGTYIPRPKEGSYRTTTASLTGAIAIQLPTALYSGISDMMSFWVDIYDYAGNESVSIFVYGYAYGSATGQWTNTGATILSPRNDKDFTVRFGHDGTRHIVCIGEVTSTWSYPQIVVRDFQAGYSAVPETFDDGWNIGFVTTLPTVMATSANNYPVSKSLSVARTISLTGDATGSGTFDGSANLSIAVSVADDSHNHIIDNVDGLQTALDAKAALASPALTGTPTAPTAAVGTNTTQIATTAFVAAEIAADAPTKTGGGASGTWAISVSGSAATLTTARTLTIGSTGKTFNGSANVSWTLAEIGAAASTHTHALNDITSTTAGTVDVSTSGYLEAGRGSGGVALTVNDTQGNANVAFNHRGGVPEQAGNSGRITVNTDATTNASMQFQLQSGVTAGTAVSLTTIMSVLTTGISVTGDITSSSDIRQKTNVRTISDALEKVLSLRGVSFDWAANGRSSIGVIAQEVAEVVPEVVAEDTDGRLSVAYGNMVGLLVEAIKELSAKVARLEAAQ